MALADDLAAAQTALWNVRNDAEAEVLSATENLVALRRAREDTTEAEARLAAAEQALAAAKEDEPKYRDLLMLSMTLAQFPSMESAVAAEFKRIMAA